MIRTDRWKLIIYDVDGKRTYQLFDLHNDPWEKNNLAEASAHKGRLGELTRRLKELAQKAGDPSELANAIK